MWMDLLAVNRFRKNPEKQATLTRFNVPNVQGSLVIGAW